MKRTISANFAIVIGLFLLIEGLWGMVSSVVFWVFTTNTTHAAIHIILGTLGIIAGFRNNARVYCGFLGALLLLVGVLHFLPKVGDWMFNILAVNTYVAALNIIIGLIAIAAAIDKREVINPGTAA